MYVWTDKAERDYRLRHPGEKCKRIAGDVATYDGAPVINDTVRNAFAMRGWIRKSTESKPFLVKEGCCDERRKREGNKLADKEIKKRWDKLKLWCKTYQDESMRSIEKAMRIKGDGQIHNFCAKYGVYAAEKYGKLPRMSKNTFRSGIWLYIMEQ